MDEIVLEETPQEENGTEFYLGTVKHWSNVTGVQVQLDGQDEPMTKKFKQMQMCRPLKIGSRVVVMKHSGTYIVLGEVSLPTLYYHPSNLSNSATQAQIIDRCNLILDIMRNAGMIWEP